MADGKTRRVLSNDDGWIMDLSDPPLAIDQMHDNMIAPYGESPVDTFLWSVGGHEVFVYETEVGQRFGADQESLYDTKHQVRDQNLQHMIREHGGPVTVISRMCREAGMKFFPSVRMNEHYDMPESSPNYGRFRRENPQWLIGRPGEQLPEGSLFHGIRTGVNYLFPEVRSLMSRIILELVERFDVDGIELDFMRHPAFFRPEEAYTNRYLMTDLVRHVRSGMNQVAGKQGKTLELAVRVPPTLADSSRIGLDAELWIRKGLVDIVIAGGGFIPFETSIEEFVHTAKDTDCLILGCFESHRPALDTAVLRAIAARYWDQGADGLYFFNYYSMSHEWKKSVLGELADPDRLARLDKQYEFDITSRERPTSQHSHAFHNAIPLTQLPINLEKTDSERGSLLYFEIADDVFTAKADGGLKKCALGLLFDRIDDDDELEIKLNDSIVAWHSRSTPASEWCQRVYDPYWEAFPSKTHTVPLEGAPIEFDVGVPPLKSGQNVLEIKTIKNSRESSLLLRNIRVSIQYRDL